MKSPDAKLIDLLTNIKQHLGEKNLATELEMTIKHLPTYNKIVKTHIAQLQNVLASDNHHNKNLENVNLSPTVRQLISIFEQLQDDDLAKLEELYLLASKWSNTTTIETTTNSTGVTSEATL